MNVLRLFWSFIRHAGQWLEVLENRVWMPETPEFPVAPKRTMWDD